MKRVISMVLVFAMVMMMSLTVVGCAKEETNETTNSEVAVGETSATAVTTESKTNFPERPINNIVPFGAGGGTDSWNRALSAAMEAPLGVKILVNNMTGGGPGGTGQAYVWEAKHDGYTMLGTSETPLLVPVMTGMKQTTDDFVYYIAGGSPGLLLANKNAGITSMADLMDMAKTKPNEIKVASTAGGLWFILANLFNSYGDVPLGNVTYDGSRPAITACVSGETALVVASAGEVADFIKSGDLIPLTTIQTTDYDMTGHGIIPSVITSIPSLEKYLPLNQWIGFMLPADTDAAIIAKFEEAFKVAMASQEIQDFATSQYAVIYNLTGEEASAVAAKAQSTMSWILNDMGLTEYSPEEFNIPRP
ncbi:tripartite tricarboxylate transporter substrate binding protein [Fusibacter bizertensis]|uniref:Tripartite tricarboxylate transporter substrate binding protein n=1 Tax=Fusibacter bizertensis TaxID=1488331 RepID=A0ABT6NCE0_9FIRM|nr:tripartite tricarboxylate transporter substrate binding protein [Fusibacter bizertensis]MDH8678081.1 tripartite tricarboxylate transporter substrate binding protein [Fusibacter bizertensis]